jgi:hypothetical protein
MSKAKGKEAAVSAIERLRAVLQSGFASGMFSAPNKSDVLVRAAYLRGVSDAIDIIQEEIDSRAVVVKYNSSISD